MAPSNASVLGWPKSELGGRSSYARIGGRIGFGISSGEDLYELFLLLIPKFLGLLGHIHELTAIAVLVLPLGLLGRIDDVLPGGGSLEL